MKISEFDEQVERNNGDSEGVTHYATGIALIYSGRVLITRRVPDDFLGGYYELPGGGVDDGETIIKGAQREAKEELGIEIEQFIDIHQAFDYPTRTKKKVRQYNLVARASSKKVTLNPKEHDDYQWVDQTNYKEFKTTQAVIDSLEYIFESIL